MTAGDPPRSLIVLVADKNASHAVQGILSRPRSLGIQPVPHTIRVHPHHDPGCLLEGANFLSLFQQTHSHALVLFDLAGCGREARGRDQLESEVEERLSKAGWAGRSAAVVLDPELEIWVWADTPHLPREIRWGSDYASLKGWAEEQGFAFSSTGKPLQPKEALQRALLVRDIPRSSDLYLTLASQVSLNRCVDPAFAKFKRKLQEWFGPADSAQNLPLA